MGAARAFKAWLAPLVAAAALSACAETQFIAQTAKRFGKPEPQTTYKVGNPYQVNGVWYYPQEDYNYDETGIASWYGSDFHGRATANGEIFDMNAVTAAHKTLPMPSVARVTNLENGRSLIVRVNDRGPFVAGRIIDLSRRSAQLLGVEQKGTARVRVQILAEESRVLAARLKGAPGAAAVAGTKADTPITVASLPKATVSSEDLPPPPGAANAPPPKPLRPATPGNAVLVGGTETADASQTAVKVGTLAHGPPRATQIYVQAGAFGQYDNAHRVQAILSGYGPAKISSVLINGRDLYRVRLGPVASVEQADRLLDSVIQAGYPGARVIVD